MTKQNPKPTPPPLGTAQVEDLPPRRRISTALSALLIIGGILLVGAGLYLPLKDQWVLMQNSPPTSPPDTTSANTLSVSTEITENADSALSLADNPLPVVIDSAVEEPIATPQPTAAAAPTPAATTNQTTDTLTIAAPPGMEKPAPTDTPLPVAPVPISLPPAQSPPVRLVAEAINLDTPVIENGWHVETIGGQEVSVWDVVEYAAGWHKNSALPGQQGNVVLSGHHNIAGEVFRNLVDLEPGDSVTLYADDRPYRYVVEDKFILKDKGEPEEIRRANARWIGPFNDQRLTMVTCWPYSNNSHRVVVIAKPEQQISGTP